MPVTPGLQLPFGIQPTNPLPVDSLSGPFTGATIGAAIAAANAAISSALRFQSMEVRLIVGGYSYKYWYWDGTGDANLVEMQTTSSGISGPYVSSFNGLTGAVVGVSSVNGATGAVQVVNSFNGSTGAVIGVSSILGTTGEIEVSGTTGSVTVGLPNTVIIGTSIVISGITLSASGGNIFISGGLSVLGNIDNTGSLSVDGLIITKTGFSGFTGDSDLEAVESVMLDGGEY